MGRHSHFPPQPSALSAASKIAQFVLVVCLAATGGAAEPSKSGLVLWLAGDKVEGDSKHVARWLDQSGQGNHLTQSMDGRRPAQVASGIGGRPTLQFDGGDSLDRPALQGLESGDQPFHAIFVMRAAMHPAHPNPRLLDLSGDDPAERRGFWVGYQANGRNRLGINNGDEGEARSIAWNDRPNLLEVVYYGNQRWAQFLNGEPDGNGVYRDRTMLGFRDTVRVAIGQHAGLNFANTFYAGQLAEVLVYNRALTAAEQNALGDYLQSKYSLETIYGPTPHFERDIRPILKRRCFECHGESAKEANLDLRSVSSMLRGGDSGPVVVRGRAGFSALLEMTESGAMPPKDSGQQRLDPKQLRVLRRWIQMGLPADEKVVEVDPASLVRPEDRAFWAFQKLQRPSVPDVADPSRVRTAIDAFVQARLEPVGLGLSSEANRTVLARRVYVDLLGLPPTEAELEQFLQDADSGAYERLVDRLLESPHFGERLGRAWLDWVGYVDTFGSDNDANTINKLERKWEYRDYVIRSFNQNKPLDRFIVEQLAGDELTDWREAETLTPAMRDSLVATGFLLCSADDTNAPELNTPDTHHEVLQRTSEIISNSLLGLTLQCAKCHNHKYEAISQLDYYRWQAFFAPAFNPDNWVISTARGMPDVSPKQKAAIDRRNNEIAKQVGELEKRLSTLRARYSKQVIAAKVKQLPEPIREDVQAAVSIEPKKRNDIQKYLVEKLGKWAQAESSEIDAAMSAEDKAEQARLRKSVADLNAQRQTYHTIQVVRDAGAPTSTYVLRRGDYLKPSREVGPGLLAVLTGPAASETPPAATSAPSSGRRLQLARQLTDGDSIAGAVVTRVFVNRLWQQLLGEGVFATSDNIGVSGARPTHPKLLDWLAAELIKRNWQVKPLVKTIVMSQVYRQTALANGKGESIDPANKLLWRARLRRLDSESVRDAMLTVSGKLNRQLGGPPLELKVQPDGKVIIDVSKLPSPDDQWRRSAYVLARRNYHLSMLATFDQPVVATNCTQRRPSAVVTQSLALLNDEFVMQQAAFAAARIVKSTGSDASHEQLVERAFQLTLHRSPSSEELQDCAALLERHARRYREAGLADAERPTRTLAHLCQMLFNTNEFLYVQ